ncbi:MAG: TIGR04150 pseudo-rSAM protein [Candidatus Azobacteroides sp.]|nr:TIGR04150 pseudo-rSAM protein [Candidatus Azobacteroides sp.]
MKKKNNTNDYWFTIEPYVYVSITNQCALLYNTLDGVILESDKIEVIKLLQETLQKENCGVVLLTNEKFKQKNINDFIQKLRDKYMGDVIDVTLSKGKPVQLLPYFNFPNKLEIYKKHNFSPSKKIFENLFEISIHVNHTINIDCILSFLQSLPENVTFNIIGNIRDVTNYTQLLSFLDKAPSPKYLLCSYNNLITLQPDFENNFSYQILTQFPLDIQQWERSRKMIVNQTLPVEYIFDVCSDDDYKQAEHLVEQYQIEKYRLKPKYTGENIRFFEEMVFLTKDDILSTPMTLKDFFSRQAMNIYDFGKINIMPNGDAYANVNHPKLGNIFTHSIHEIVYKEMEEGKSWFRTRSQAPCNSCVYQWLCPPPSNYEIEIGRTNLCHVK